MLYFLLFIEGFIGLTYQIFFFRQLTPQVGSSSMVDAWTIGAFLGALSLGYFAGGKKADEPLSKFGRNLLITAIVGGVGMSSPFMSLYFSAVSPSLGIMPGLVLYALLVVTPIAYLMGQSLPLLMQVSKWGRTDAEKGGNALSLSTIGSMAGAIVPITFLAPAIGATATLLLNTSLAITVGLFLYRKKKRAWFILLPISIFAQMFLLFPYWGLSDGKFTSTAYSDIFIIHEKNGGRMMFANGLIMSSQDKAGINTTAYIDHFQSTVSRLELQNKNILVLGSGGFMAHSKNPGNNNFTYVDIDSELADWATEHFLFKEELVNVVVDDARRYLINSEDLTWDVILVDTYGSRYSVPEHLITIEFFNLLRSKLKRNGLFMMNSIQDPIFKSKYSRNIYNTVHHAFDYCHVVHVSPSIKISNVHYTCFNEEDTNAIYQDDKHNASFEIWDEFQMD
jgi:spermidine synthase